MPDTRSDVICRHVQTALRHAGGLTRESFADAVVLLYHERTPFHLRGVQFHPFDRDADVYAVQRANAQLLFRMLDTNSNVRLASEIEESVVLSLPQPYRGECLRELAHRYGLMAVPLPAPQGGDRVVQVGEFAGAFGGCLLALAQTLGDGHLDADDAANAPRAVKELDELIALATSLREAHAMHIAPTTPGGTVREFPGRAGREV